MNTENASPRGRGHYDRRASASERAQRARGAIVAAVRELLVEREEGLPAVADVIRLTGLGRNTFYGHFRDVEEVVTELVDECGRELDAALSTGDGVQDTPHAAVQTFVRSWVEFASRQPASSSIALRMAEERVRHSIQVRVRALHQLGARAGVFRRELESERQQLLSSALAALALAVALGRARVEPSIAAGQDLFLGLCR